MHVNSTHHAWWGPGDRKRVRDRTNLRSTMETHLSLRETASVPVSTSTYYVLPSPQLLTSWKRKRLNTQDRCFLTPSPAFPPPRMAAVTSCLVWGCVFLFSARGNSTDSRSRGRVNYAWQKEFWIFVKGSQREPGSSTQHP